MGHRTKTWTKNDVLWPDELLPKKMPTARIMTFGYDADIVHFWSRPAENRVDVISNSFFSQLMNNRSAADAVCYEESPKVNRKLGMLTKHQGYPTYHLRSPQPRGSCSG